MKKLYVFITFLICTLTTNAQLFYTETFDGVTCASSGCDPSLVSWTTTVTGTEGAFPNQWYVSCLENGNAVGLCGTSCTVGSGGDQSLHVGNMAGSPGSMFVCPGGDCGAVYDASAGCETSRRVESPTINCTAFGTITVDWAYMELGQGAIDDCTFWYFDGTTWAQIDAIAKPVMSGCFGQGKWSAYSVLLPASANGNPNVKIGFQWVNNGDNIGSDPSFAVDDITLTAAGFPPVASFTAVPASPCVGAPATFTNTSTYGPFTSTVWSFPGGTPSSSTAASPTVVYPTAGTYTVTLIVTNAVGTDTIVQTVNAINCVPPTANATASQTTFCFVNCIDYTNMSSSTTGTFTCAWSFPGGTPSTSTAITPPSICYNTPGVYTTQLIVMDTQGADTMSITITVDSCYAPPVADFGTASYTICNNDCINFADSSTNNPLTWQWAFGGGAVPSSSTAQNPTGICFPNFGTFPVTLTVTNPAGVSTSTQMITVLNCSPPIVSFGSPNKVCQGACIPVNNNTFYADTYLWDAPGATPSTSTLEEPGSFCFDTAGTYTITLTATNAYGTNSFSKTIIVDTFPIIEAFPDMIGISIGSSADLYVVANGTVDIAWETIDTASIGDTTLANVTVTPTAPGVVMYYVYATGNNGCTNRDSVIVEVNLADVIGVPNAFSPNGDGFNDYLKVLGPGIVSMKLIVYNRYGQEIFTSTNQETGWDGRHNGKASDPGVFAWYLEYELENGYKGLKKGNVSLIR